MKFNIHWSSFFQRFQLHLSVCWEDTAKSEPWTLSSDLSCFLFSRSKIKFHCPPFHNVNICPPGSRGQSHVTVIFSSSSFLLKRAAEIIIVCMRSWLNIFIHPSQHLSHLSTLSPFLDYNLYRQLNIIISNYYNYYRRFKGRNLYLDHA